MEVESKTDSEIKQILNKIEKLERALISQQRLKKDLEKLDVAMQMLIKQQHNLMGRFELHHSQTISLFQRLKLFIREFFEPRLGKLHQYDGRELGIPLSYYELPDVTQSLKISIVTPSFKQANFIERTIKSVLEQNYSNLEYIIQDGQSNDGTVEILHKYSTHLKHWASEPDKGQSHAINLGFKYAEGEIMAYLNSDDLLLPGALHYIADYFAKNPDVDVVYGHRVLIDDMDYEIGRWVLPPHSNHILSWADFIPQETMFWRRRIWDKAGGTIDENFKFAMDWDLILRFRDAGAKFVRLPRFLGAFRVHPQQKSTALISEVGRREMDLLRIRCVGRSVNHLEVKLHLFGYMLKHIICNKLYRSGWFSY